jgi:hypothetical protein
METNAHGYLTRRNHAIVGLLDASGSFDLVRWL